MTETLSVDQVRSTVEELFPDAASRSAGLRHLRDAILQADSRGSNKWGAYCIPERVRFLVGSIIVLSLEQNNHLWLALDNEILDASPGRMDELERTELWRWDTHGYLEYKRVPSRNGYYSPGAGRSDAWPTIRELSLKYIDRVAGSFQALRRDSQLKHMPALVQYLREELASHVPEPDYGQVGIFQSPQRTEDFVLAEEVLEGPLYEGGKYEVKVNAYERNPRARQLCIAYYGARCAICGFSFSEVYGEIGEGFIFVHHVKPLSEVTAQYEVDPIMDLIPVCGNCHAMLHRNRTPYTVEEIRSCLNPHI